MWFAKIGRFDDGDVGYERAAADESNAKEEAEEGQHRDGEEH